MEFVFMDAKINTSVVFGQRVLLYKSAKRAYLFDMERKINLGRRVRDTRKALRMTQERLSELTGASQASISALETRNSENTVFLFEFAKALQVNPEWLLTGHGDPGESRDQDWEQIKKSYEKLSNLSRARLRAYAEGMLEIENQSKKSKLFEIKPHEIT